MRISGEAREHTAVAKSSSRVNLYDDDDEWTGLTLMLGNLVRVAFLLFVPFIGLLFYLYHA